MISEHDDFVCTLPPPPKASPQALQQMINGSFKCNVNILWRPGYNEARLCDDSLRDIVDTCALEKAAIVFFTNIPRNKITMKNVGILHEFTDAIIHVDTISRVKDINALSILLDNTPLMVHDDYSWSQFCKQLSHAKTNPPRITFCSV